MTLWPDVPKLPVWPRPRYTYIYVHVHDIDIDGIAANVSHMYLPAVGIGNAWFHCKRGRGIC